MALRLFPHAPLSQRLMLLTYRGRRSGRRYTIPIGYYPWDEGVLSISSTRWLVNVRCGEPVELWIRGQRHAAVATVYEARDEVAARLREMAERFGPKAARGLLLGLPRDRAPNDSELTRAAERTAVIRFQFRPSSS
jgi:hypothetical protein